MVRFRERRLLARASKRFEPGETVDVWCRAWVSQVAKRRRSQRFAPRWLDFVVLTNHRLLVYSAHHFTRRPGDRVIADRLDEVTVEVFGSRSNRFRVSAPRRPTMLVEFGRGRHAREAVEILRRAAVDTQTRAASDMVGDAPHARSAYAGDSLIPGTPT